MDEHHSDDSGDGLTVTVAVAETLPSAMAERHSDDSGDGLAAFTVAVAETLSAAMAERD